MLLLFATNLYSVAQTKKEKTKDDDPEVALKKLADANGVSRTDVINVLSGTPVSSGLTYSALSQYIQSTVTTGSNGGFNFKSSLFGLQYLFSGTKKDSLSGYYLSHTGARNQEISFGLNKASKTTDQLSTITVGYKIAINHRDKSIVNFEKMDTILSEGIDLAGHSLNIVADIYSTDLVIAIIKGGSLNENDLKMTLLAADKIKAANLKDATKPMWTKEDFKSIFQGTSIDTNGQDYKALEKKLDGELLQIGDLQNTYTAGKDIAGANKRYKIIADSIFSKLGFTYAQLHKNLQNEYTAIAKKIEMRSLTTFSINPGYNIQYHHADTSTVTFRYLKGFGNNKKPWNIDFQTVLVSLRDSAATPSDFAHNKLKFILGFNKVFAVDDKANPLLESELAAEYDDVISGRYAHERMEVVTANLVTTIHLLKEFSLPLTLRYDIKKPTLFGFLSVQWNLQDSGKTSTKN